MLARAWRTRPPPPCCCCCCCCKFVEVQPSYPEKSVAASCCYSRNFGLRGLLSCRFDFDACLGIWRAARMLRNRPCNVCALMWEKKPGLVLIFSRTAGGVSLHIDARFVCVILCDFGGVLHRVHHQ